MRGKGTKSYPYQILTKEDLDEVNNDLSAHYKLMKNLDFKGKIYDKAVITPIYCELEFHSYIRNDKDDRFVAFTGTFNGNGHIIKNLTIESKTDFIGFFGLIHQKGRVSRLGLRNCNINGKDKVGGLCGENLGSITSCFAEGEIKGDWEVGGLCGLNQCGGSINLSYFNGKVIGNSAVGGLCGGNDYSAQIEFSVASCLVTGSKNVGGLVGFNSYNGVVSCCIANGFASRNAGYGSKLIGYSHSASRELSFAFSKKIKIVETTMQNNTKIGITDIIQKWWQITSTKVLIMVLYFFYLLFTFLIWLGFAVLVLIIPALIYLILWALNVVQMAMWLKYAFIIYSFLLFTALIFGVNNRKKIKLLFYEIIYEQLDKTA